MEEKEQMASVPFYIHEATCDKLERSNERAMEKMNLSNKRLLAALITVCVTLIITVGCFLLAYRDMNNTWLAFYESHAIEGVQDGAVFVQGDAADNQAAFQG